MWKERSTGGCDDLREMVKGDAMNHIVRRSAQTAAITETGAQLPARSHQGNGFIVASQLTVDVEPRLSLAWRVEQWYWNDGFTLLVFHSTAGFCPQQYPDDLNLHGRLIIETREDATFAQVPEEGSHFFTFVLHKKVFLGLREKLSVLRFSEIVPSAKVAIGRIKDRIELQNMRQQHEVGEIAHEANLNEQKLRRLRSQQKLEECENPPVKTPQSGIDPLIAEELEDIDAMVEAMFARNQKVSELKKSERFRKLSPREREAVMERIAERLDAAEIGARREMRRSQKKG
jgi:hypothetical protein